MQILFGKKVDKEWNNDKVDWNKSDYLNGSRWNLVNVNKPSIDYAMEQMFFVIDSRYRSRKPMIITTNLKLAELKNPPDLAHARIYDRILERCAPILFDGKNFREENAGATRQTAKDIVNSKQD